jgi:hypothetical protein
MVSEEADYDFTRRGERGSVVCKRDQPQVSQDAGVQLQRGEGDSPDEGQILQALGDRPAVRFRQVFEDEPLVLVESFR